MDFSRICPEPESRIWKMSEELIVKIKLSLQPEFVTGAFCPQGMSGEKNPESKPETMIIIK